MLMEFMLLRHMVRRLHNWRYRDVIGFLKKRGFIFYKELGGSNEKWIKGDADGDIHRVVEVNFTRGSYHVMTLKKIIRQSGINQNEWIKWNGS
jgi:hypothetical protein